MQTPLTFFLLFIAVLALIAGVFWLVRRFAGSRLGSNANRGRLPRLAVIDAAAVDGRRRLVLVRRDNVEHLLMIGGPSDIVIEPNIVRATPQREPVAPRGPVGAELPPRVPLPEADRWHEPAPELPELQEPALPDLPPRPARVPFADDMRRPTPVAAERRLPEPPPGLAPEPALRPEPPLPRRPMPRSERSEAPLPRSEPLVPRSEPLVPRGELPMRGEALVRGEPSMRGEPVIPRSDVVPRAEPRMPRSPAPPIEPEAKQPPLRERVVPPPPPAPAVTADQNLAEMAQRLEAALRRPMDAPDRAPPVAPEAPPSRSAPLPHRSAAPAETAAPSAAPPVPPPGPKISLDNLEDEMANLLGRPKSPT